METSLTSLAQNLDSRQSQLARLESLVNASPIAMFICEARGDFSCTFVTEGVRAVWGYDPEEFLNKRGFWTDRIHPDDEAAVYGHLALVLKNGAHRYDYRFRTKSGEYRWTHDELRLVKDSSGNPLEITGYSFDITEQKMAEAALRESEALQKVIFNSTSDLQGLFRVEPGMEGRYTFITESVNRAMGENLRSRMGHAAPEFLDKDFRELLAATGLSTDQIEQRRALYCRAVDERNPLRFDTPSSELRDALEVSVYPVIDQHGTCTHILWNGRNIAKRIAAEAGRRESEERYALVTEAIHEGIFDWNLVTGVSYLSPRYKEILGFRDDELPNDGESFFGRVHPEDAPRMIETRDRYSEDTTKDRFLDEVRLKHRDGTYRWVVSRGRILRNDRGEPIRIVGAIGDMTDRMESAAKLAASEKRLRDIIGSLFGFVGVFTLDGKLIECNRSPFESTGVTVDDLVRQPFWETPGWSENPAEQAQVRLMMMRAVQGEVVRFETAPMARGERPMVGDIPFGPLG